MFSSNTSQISSDALFIEDVMSTFLYAGTGPSAGQTITNNIDLSTEGGMTWIKNRTDAGTYPTIVDTVRGATKELYTNQTVAQSTVSNGVTAFTTSGFTLGTDTAGGNVNYAYSSPSNFVSWTFRKAPKFFDVVTYTGDGSSAWRYITHSLGSRPGFVVVKNITSSSDWLVWHPIMDGSAYNMILNSTAASNSSNESQGRLYVESSGAYRLMVRNTDASGNPVTGTNVNASGATYVAYLFAHNAGGFGLNGTDNVISCGSFTTDGSGNATVNLGYEPQFLIDKRVDSTENWRVFDSMRGWTSGNGGQGLYPNLSNAETTNPSDSGSPTATGFTQKSRFANATYIYIAIRRGPMKTPTSGTSVFAPVAYTGNGSNTTINTGFPTDLYMWKERPGTYASVEVHDRLRGSPQYFFTGSTNAEATYSSSPTLDNNVGVFLTASGGYNNSGTSNILWNFRRAPGFFDQVCYTGNGTSQNVSHNLRVAPELMVVKTRNGSGGNWYVYASSLTVSGVLFLNTTNANLGPAGYVWNSSAPTASVFSVGNEAGVNQSGFTFVAYLFASCPGVSKVGSYTGNGSSQTINCGFTGGARFVMIKATSTTGNWIVFDSARGIITGDDPFLALNTTAAESSGDYIDPDSSGFTLPSATLNNSGVSYIYLAIA